MFKEKLEGYCDPTEGKDTITWEYNNKLYFSVALCYEFYDNALIPYGLPSKFDGVYQLVWKLEVPLKIKVVDWRLLLNRLLTKDLLI